MGLEDTLTADVGPLPLWGWAAGVAGIGVGYMAWKASRDNQAAEQAYDGASPDGMWQSEEGPEVGPVEIGFGDYGPPTGSTIPQAQGTPPIQTNEQWVKVAGDYLVSEGKDPVLVANALTKYASRGGMNTYTGQVTPRPTLSYSELAVVALALVKFGQPPGGIDPVTQVPAPTVPGNPTPAPVTPNPVTPTPVPSKATTPTPQNRTYIVVRGDSLWEIATKMLGSPFLWRRIYDLNKTTIEAEAKRRGYRSSGNGWWIFPGTKLVIPPK